MSRFWHILIILFLVSFLSCEETSSFLLDLDNEIQIRTIESGEVLNRGSEIPLVLEYNTKAVSPDNIVVEYTDSNNVFLGKTEINRGVKSGETLPSIIIPESLAAGKYYLLIRLKEQENVIKEQKIPFFILEEALDIRGMTVYPPQLKPGGIAVIKAEVSSQKGINPWLRWKRGVQTLMEGSLSEGLDTCYYTVPDAVGLYPIELEIYPEKPETGFVPAQSAKAEVTVSHDVVEETRSLGSPENYRILFNFWGSLDNDGKSAGLSSPARSHKARPDVLNGQYGLRMTSDSGLIVDQFLLPVPQGRIAPFTLTFHGAFQKPDKEAVVISTRDQTGALQFSILVNKAGYLVARWIISGNVQELVLNTQPVQEMDQRWISLNGYPGETSLALAWFVDGRMVRRGWIASIPRNITDEGQTVIGSSGQENGISGFLDELGIYTTDDKGFPSRDPSLFRFCQESIYNNRLIFAEGFDRKDSGPDWELADSQLKVRPLGAFTAATWQIPEGNSTVRMAFPPGALGSFGAGTVLQIKDAEDPKIAVLVDLKGRRLLSGNQELPVSLSNDGVLTLYFFREGKTLLVKSEESATGLPFVSKGPVQLVLVSGNKKDSLILDELLIIRN